MPTSRPTPPRSRYEHPTKPGSVALNQWSFISLTINSTSSRDLVIDGVRGAEQTDPDTGRIVVAPWPAPNVIRTGLAITFGSYYNNTEGPNFGVDSHVYNGGLRDWAAVSGTPTPAELERMRNGEDPIAIWGKERVFGYWHFTANPQLGQKEPDVSGHGHELSYIDAGRAQGHSLPVLVTPASPVRPTPAIAH